MIKCSLQWSYTLIAPIYDSIVQSPTAKARQHSLSQVDLHGNVLLCGIGSGLDIPYLADNADYIGIDLTLAMLHRAQKRIQQHPVSLHQGDVMQLPYQDHSFDFVVMHLILAVVPEPQKALDEVKRVLKPNGQLIIFDKFLHPHQFAPIRRLMSPIMGKLATRTNVEFESLDITGLELQCDQAALFNGWFRHIVLQKDAT
ncbi:class I SAM-dependent methyltransferase [Candidatus Albibeggiatoa sp. nov. NOAA]|uniref:class I SAM-dependent methyltransferase n=1 Tax=Candidatus Albibeggiatoa sp. nov. NOAA TaxID=3162724 RepID=UPI0032FF947A|nr:class I SAM-dependent methyltransferase [Thiotrichaceae bacterium]